MQLQKPLIKLSQGFNALAGAAVIAMMLVTCADVVLRLFRRPVPGAYEIIGFLCAVVASFSLAYTSLEKGHIAVEILVERLPRPAQVVIEAVVSLLGSALFALLAWQSAVYAADLKFSGEVSVTLALPIYPVVYGLGAGSALLCLVLLAEGAQAARKAVKG